MSSVVHCSSCGTEVSAETSPQGLCPACLLKLGLSSPNIALPPPPKPARKVAWITWVATVITLIVAAAFIGWFLFRPAPEESRVFRFAVPVPGERSDFALSPDGRRLVYTATDEEGKTHLWLHPMDSPVDQIIPGSADASFPFWSPDSRSIGFFAQRKLKKVDISYGGVQMLADAPSGHGGTWSAEGMIVFAPNSSGPLFRISAAGGMPVPATTLDQSSGIRSHRWPQFLPDGRTVIYSATASRPEGTGVFAVSFNSGESRRLLNDFSPAVYSNENLLFVRGGVLLAQPFNLRRMDFDGDARPVRFVEGLETGPASLPAFSASQNGVLAYRKGEPAPTRLIWLDRYGKWLSAIDDLSGFGDFAIAPDNRSVAVSRAGDIWVVDLARGVRSRLTFNSGDDSFPLWTPTGEHLLFVSDRQGERSIYRKAANGMSEEEVVLKLRDLESIDSLSPDGRFVSYTLRDAKGKYGIGFLPLSGERKPFALSSSFNLRRAQFAPDGRSIAYLSDESGRDEIYIQPFPPMDAKWQLSSEGGSAPKWRRDGRELFFISPAGRLMAVPVRTTAGAPEIGAPLALFSYRGGLYDASPDGRFLISVSSESNPPPPLNVVVNWHVELER